jgi:hypothetical protein
MCALDRRRTRPPPYRIAPSRPTSCGGGLNKADLGLRLDLVVGERFSGRESGLASVRAPPLPPPAGSARLANTHLSLQ